MSDGIEETDYRRQAVQQPHALTREQCSLCTANRPRLCDQHYKQGADELLKHVTAAIQDQQTPGGVKATYEQLLELCNQQRQALTRQAQEIERLKAAHQQLTTMYHTDMTNAAQHLTAMTAERDEITLRWKHEFELRCDEEEKNEQLNKQLAASQARVRELEEEKANAEPDTRLFITVTDHESQLATLQATLAERERDINQAEGVIMLREAICRHSEPLPQVFAACHASGGHASQLGD